ncbi:MAG: hypothetical protein KJ574_03800, partial [Nanoarchaeota archaeon]|nr:hypothetical protein [Nanoarchaeota archaeon]
NSHNALDVISQLIEYTILYGPKGPNVDKLVDYLIDFHARLIENSFNYIAAEVQSCFLEDLTDRIKCCISGKGSEREASLTYSLDENIHIFSFNTYRYNRKESTIGKAILVETHNVQQSSESRDRRFLVLDGVIAADLVKKIAEMPVSKQSLDWREILYKVILRFSEVLGYPKIVVNISHGNAQQTVQDFVRYVADRQGLREGRDYTFNAEDDKKDFRLTAEGYQRVGTKTLPNGLRYTHHLRKEPLDAKLIKELSRGDWAGEAYLDAWFINDAYNHLMQVKNAHHLETTDPYEILRFIKSSPILNEEFAAKHVNWTKADGYVLGIEIDPFEQYLQEEIRTNDMSEEMAEELRSFVLNPPQPPAKDSPKKYPFLYESEDNRYSLEETDTEVHYDSDDDVPF